MARYALVFRMFIASPDDANDYRDTIYAAAQRWNTIADSVSAGVLLEPVGWEQVRPEHNKKGGQNSIDNEALESADLLPPLSG